MQIRSTFLPSDLQYCLDGASEYEHISAGSDIAIRLYGSSERLDHIWNAERPKIARTRHTGWLGERELETEAYGIEIIKQLPAARRDRLADIGMKSIFRFILNLADILAEWRFEDMTKGGCLEPYLKQWRLDDKMRPTPKVDRRLNSHALIREYVKDYECGHLQTLYDSLMTLPMEQSSEPDCLIFSDLDGQMETNQREHRRALADAKFFAKHMPKPDKRAIRSERKVTKRAALVAAALLGAQTVSSFAVGNAVTLIGPDFNISVALARTIHSKGHGALQISVQGQEGEQVAKLCLFQEAPALDQLVSLALHVQSGNIEDVMRTGNLYAVEKAEHPAIANRKKPTVGNELFARVQRLDLNQDDVFKAQKLDYVKKFRRVYADALATKVIGSHGPVARAMRLKYSEHARIY